MGSLRNLVTNHTAREQMLPPRRNRKSPNSYSIKWHLYCKERLKIGLKQRFPDITFKIMARSDRVRRTIDYLSPKFRWVEVSWMDIISFVEKQIICDEIKRCIREECQHLNYDSKDFTITIGVGYIHIEEKFSWDH
jgi:hypothetical protein